MSNDAPLCYCTMLTLAEFQAAVRAGTWPLPGKAESGKLCTGCAGDLRWWLARSQKTETQ